MLYQDLPLSTANDETIGMQTQSVGQDEEVMIEDGRGMLTPTQEVEQKLLRALHADPALVSQLQRVYRQRPR